MTRSTVSVVIPNMNRTEPLRKALSSIAAQTLKPIETIVVDDKSSDDQIVEIRKIIAEFKDTASARMIELPANGGANKARNVGIFEAKGTHIAFLDSDDLWLPRKLEVQMREIEELPANKQKRVLSTTSRYRVNGAGEVIFTHLVPVDLPFKRLKASNILGTLSAALVGTEVAREIGGFDETLPSCQDWDFFLRLFERVSYVGVRRPLCVYVDHDEDRITLNNRRRLKGHLRIYSKHIREELKSGGAVRPEFYRNIAEDLQGLGKKRMAARFLARSIANKHARNKLKRRAIFYTLMCRYRFSPPEDIAAARYRKYGRKSHQLPIPDAEFISKSFTN